MLEDNHDKELIFCGGQDFSSIHSSAVFCKTTIPVHADAVSPAALSVHLLYSFPVEIWGAGLCCAKFFCSAFSNNKCGFCPLPLTGARGGAPQPGPRWHHERRGFFLRFAQKREAAYALGIHPVPTAEETPLHAGEGLLGSLGAVGMGMGQEVSSWRGEEMAPLK